MNSILIYIIIVNTKINDTVKILYKVLIFNDICIFLKDIIMLIHIYFDHMLAMNSRTSFVSPDDRFSMVYFKMEHEGCWTGITKEHNIAIHTLKIIPLKDRNNIYGLFEIRAQGKKEFRDFLRRINREKTIHRVMAYSPSELRKNVYFIDLYEVYGGMIEGILNDYQSIFEYDVVRRGVEEKYAIIPSDRVLELKNSINGLGKIYQFKARCIKNFYYAFSPFLSYTPSEMQIIAEAVSRGYYSIPRHVGIRDLAEYFGMSKSTVQEYLRKAEQKTMNNLKLLKLMNEMKE